MEKLIIIKYGELSTKKDNINFFLKTLKRNIDGALKNIEHNITYDFGRMFVEVSEDKIDDCVGILKSIFGIYEIIIGFRDNNRDLEVIKDKALGLIKNLDFKTFKIATKRSDKNYTPNSMEVSRLVGAHILKNIEGIEVDVNKPDVLFEIEIRKNEVLYYHNGVMGVGGYPVGTLGKGMLMLSGGIDSPVAGYLTVKRGVRLEAIYFESPPHTSEQAKEKVIRLTKELAKYNGVVRLHVINFTQIQEEILKNIPHEYLITIMRRMMYRISAIVASNNNCHILVNGESIGQVASQTLTSMKCINEVVKLPVIRPVACYDKIEIINIAKKIGTYEISTLPFEDCCTIFVPDHPVINPNLGKCCEYEKLINYEQMIYEAISNREVLKIDQDYEIENFNDIL